MKTREQWVEEVMLKFEELRKTAWLFNDPLEAILAERENFRALLLEVPEPDLMISSIVGIDKDGVILPLHIETISPAVDGVQILVHLPAARI